MGRDDVSDAALLELWRFILACHSERTDGKRSLFGLLAGKAKAFPAFVLAEGLSQSITDSAG